MSRASPQRSWCSIVVRGRVYAADDRTVKEIESIHREIQLKSLVKAEPPSQAEVYCREVRQIVKVARLPRNSTSGRSSEGADFRAGEAAIALQRLIGLVRQHRSPDVCVVGLTRRGRNNGRSRPVVQE